MPSRSVPAHYAAPDAQGWTNLQDASIDGERGNDTSASIEHEQGPMTYDGVTTSTQGRSQGGSGFSFSRFRSRPSTQSGSHQQANPTHAAGFSSSPTPGPSEPTKKPSSAGVADLQPQSGPRRVYGLPVQGTTIDAPTATNWNHFSSPVATTMDSRQSPSRLNGERNGANTMNSSINSAASGLYGTKFASLGGSSSQPYSVSSTMSRGEASVSTFATTATDPTSTSAGLSVEPGSFAETWHRRLRSLMYLKQSVASISQNSAAGRSSGGTPWLDTAKVTKRDMELYDDAERMHKRTARKYMLGCSLAPALDISGAFECARMVLTVLTEVESLSDAGDKDRARMRNFFKNSMRSIRRSGGSELVSSLDDVGVGGPSSTTYGPSGIELLGAHVPFHLDYWQVVQTLCDVLVEIFCKLALALQHHQDQAHTSREDGHGFSAEAASNRTSLIDVMQKIETRVKKLFTQLQKEIDINARRVVREEVVSVDPTLATELGVLEEGVGGSGSTFLGGTGGQTSGTGSTGSRLGLSLRSHNLADTSL